MKIKCFKCGEPVSYQCVGCEEYLCNDCVKIGEWYFNAPDDLGFKRDENGLEHVCEDCLNG